MTRPVDAHGTYASYRDAITGLSLPRVLLDGDRLDENIASVAGRLDAAKTIRVASKSIRCVWALCRILEYGPPYRGIMAYAAEEAAFLLDQGFEDILLGYPIVRRGGIERLCDALGAGH